IIVHPCGKPTPTVVYGQSFGGPITAKVVERFAVNPDGSHNYDGALAMCGILGGPRRTLHYVLDTRVVYQYYCHNHPRPDEEQYPLYLGLPPDSTLTPAELSVRANECTGYQLPPSERSPEQQQNLTNILNVIHIPESEFRPLLGLGTFGFLQDVHITQFPGRNTLSNREVRYAGSTDDRALNRGVLRYRADRRAAAAFSADGDPTG